MSKAGIAGAIGLVALAAVTVIGLDFAGESYSVWRTGIFAPKREAIRRDTEIQSRAYSEGALRELYNLKRQWQQTDSKPARATIAAAAIHQFESMDRSRLPADLASWVAEIGG